MTAQHCEPCAGGIAPLTEDEANELVMETPGWDVVDEGKCLVPSLRFPNFREAQKFVNLVAEVAEDEGHHPDVTFGWGYATILFTTHAIGGLHGNDFIMAAKVNDIIEQATE